jgi:hypothetical protein
MALVRGVTAFRADSEQRLKVSLLISAKTGIAFQARIAAALAVMVQGLTDLIPRSDRCRSLLLRQLDQKFMN